MSFFATQNTGTVHLFFGNYLIQGVPLYIVVIGSLLLGIFISWLISLIDTFSSKLAIHGKVSEINEAHKTINKLQQENRNLEIDNARLLSNTQSTENQTVETKTESGPSFFHPLRHSMGMSSK